MELNSNLNWRVNERYHGNWVKKKGGGWKK